MMGMIETQGHSIMHAHGRVHDRDDVNEMGRRLGHYRGTEEGPPGLRPGHADSARYVEGARRGDDADAVQSRVTDEMEAVFDSVDGDGDGALSRAEFYSFTEMVVRDGLASLLARLGGGDGDDGGDEAPDIAAPPAVDGGDSGDVAAADPTGGVTAPPATDAAGGGTAGEAPAIAVDPEAPAPIVADDPEAPAPIVADDAAPAVETGDPLFDLTLASVAENFAQDGAETALALLQATQGYTEAAATA